MSLSRRPGGFTFIEMLIVTSLLGLLGSTFVHTVATTSGLSAEARVRLHAAEELRRNLLSIADRLRGASVPSLWGFDANGKSADITFRWLLGATNGIPVMSDVQEVKWQATAGVVPGISNPGAVVIIDAGVAKPLASRVPLGGFLLTQQGTTIVIQLTTYYQTTQLKTLALTDKISVTLRN